MKPKIGDTIVNNSGRIGFIISVHEGNREWSGNVNAIFGDWWELVLIYETQDLIYVGHGVWVEIDT